MSTARRGVPAPVTAVVLAVVGLLSALAGVLVHADWWGTALTWAVLATVLRASSSRWWGRPAFAGAWSLVIVWSLFPRAEGDFLVADTVAGWLLMATVPVALVVAFAGVLRGSRGPRTGTAA
ncbi:hypothetical protein [Nocardioides yefusunii]|uniref:Uncharacterized protein n=1 Tax=Nocardioides yefusunii TaxID=2500546 RepID=A0ABW1QT01_9ACTN|nr:hypothetical protein [Nocardioides yefusunii]